MADPAGRDRLGIAWMLSGAAMPWLVGRTIDTADQQDARIDFGNDTLDLKVMDVNADGLVDVVASTGTEFQTFFSLIPLEDTAYEMSKMPA